MKTSIILFLCSVVLLSPIYSQQKKIVEEVAIEWWVIPIFAVNKSGESILDLKESDIQLKVDNKKIESFSLIKKSYTKSKQTKEEVKKRKPEIPIPEPRKNVFLLFDTALSTKASTDAAKMLAKNIINRAEKDTIFYIMTIEPFAGLTFAGGQTTDKALLADIIEKKVKGKPNSRIPDPQEVVVNVGGKYGPEDVPFLSASVSKYYKRKSKSFAHSFETLYYALNSIKDNKFVYLFTEGISDAIRQADKGDSSMYREYIKEAARQLGRSGALLFIINPFAGAGADLSEASGKDSLTLLAQESKGKYLEGNDKKLLEKIENLHQAYYEIAFPAVPKSKDGIMAISIEPKNHNFEILTLSVAEKSRDYSHMKAVEQEILALNLISGNPLYKSDFTSEKVKIKKITRKKNKVTYRLQLPENYINCPLDLYKVRTGKPEQKNPTGNTSHQAYGTDTRVEKVSLRTDSPKIKMIFEKVEDNDQTFFVIINPRIKSALVHSMKKEKPETFAMSLPEPTEEWADGKTFQKEKAHADVAKNLELKEILAGAARYCERLKKAAFHYLCKEKITETQKPLTYRKNLSTDVAANPGHPLFTRSSGWEERNTIDTVKSLKYTFNYRLLKIADRIKEEREFEADNDDKNKKKQKQTHKNIPVTMNSDILKSIRFLSSKAVFAPITLLDAERQTKYHFRIIKKEELKNRPTIVLEAHPRNENDSYFIYGKIWIDRENFSVLKIKANPNSILGYNKLSKLANRLNTRILLNLETDFFQYHDGIRFPTQIHFEESYKGGPFISKYRGSREWKRTETLTTYYDYLFFDVNTDVTYE